MSMPNKSSPIPRVPKEVLQRIIPSENPFTTDVDGMIGRLNKLGGTLPRRYGWRYRTTEALNAEMAEIAATATDLLPINRLYWKDQLGNWEAYSIMNTLRVIDLARSCVWALARKEALCASLMARSALETAASFVDAARAVSATIAASGDGKISAILDPRVNLRKTTVINEELEQYSLRTIFASRLAESEAIYKPTNILTVIQRISKVQGQEFMLPTYEVLCEAAHPNMVGRMLYLHEADPGPWKGNELRTLGPGNGPIWDALVTYIVPALSWACATQVSAFHLMARTIQMVTFRLDEVQSLPS